MGKSIVISEKSFEPYKYQTKPGQDQITAETIVSGQFWPYSEVMNTKKMYTEAGVTQL